MQIANPIQMNDWGIKKFLRAVLSIQLLALIIMGSDAMGSQIPIIRQIILFIYLTFIPGLILLRVFKLHKLANIETFLYTVGLSLSVLIFTGFFMNMIFPYFGISRPISEVPLIILITAITLVLCILSYIRDKDYSDPSYLKIKEIVSPAILFLSLIPFLAIFGTYLVNFYHTNIVLIILIIAIALIVALIIFDAFIPMNLYSLAVLVIAISLLFFHSLINVYIPPWDIHQEYHLANLVKINSFWNSALPQMINGMLSIVILAPIYSDILDMDITWVLKIIYPLLYSLVPLGLYRIFQKQTDDKTSFISCFFFMSVFTFFLEMVELARQEIAELFLILLILLIMDKNMNRTLNIFLSVIFSISMIVSHYGLSYIFVFYIFFSWLLFILMESQSLRQSWIPFYFRRGMLPNTEVDLEAKEKRRISANFVLLFFILSISWYMFTSNSLTFNTMIRISDHIASTISSDFLNPDANQALNFLISKTVSPLHNVTKYLHIITQVFIIVGVLKLILRHRAMNFQDEYAAFSLLSCVICFMNLAIPGVSNSFNTTRFYHISLIFLAPFCVVGGVTVFKYLSKGFKVYTFRNENHTNLQISAKFFSIFLLIFFLFNTGFVYELERDVPYGPLGTARMMITNEVNSIDLGYVYEYDALSAGWLSKNIEKKYSVYADYISNNMVLISYGMLPLEYWFMNELSDNKLYPLGSYFYLRHANLAKNIIIGQQKRWNIDDVLPSHNKLCVLYANGGSEICYYD